MTEYLIGKQLLVAGRPELALAPLARAIRLGMCDATAYLYLGEAYEQTRNPGAARLLFEHAFSALRGNPPEVEKAIQDGLSRRRADVAPQDVSLDDLLDPPEPPPVIEHGFRYDRCEFTQISPIAADFAKRPTSLRNLYEASERAFREGDLDSAIGALQAVTLSTPFFDLRRDAIRMAARLYFSAGDEDMARRYAGFAALQPGAPLGADGCRRALEEADQLIENEEDERAIASLSRVVEEAIATEDNIAGQAMHELHRVQLIASRYKDAATTARRVITLAGVLGNPALEGIGLSMLGRALEPTPTEADATFRQAIEKLEACDEALGLAEALEGHVDVLVELGQSEEALASLARAAAIQESLGRELAVCSIFTRRAEVLLRMQRVDDARACGEEAKSRASAAGDETQLAKAHNLLARLALETGDVESMLQLMNKVIAQVPSLRSAPIPQIDKVSTLGLHAWVEALQSAGHRGGKPGSSDRAEHLLLHALEGNPRDANETLQRLDTAMETFRTQRSADGEGRTHVARARVLARAGRRNAAIEEMDHAEERFASLGNTRRLIEVWTRRGALLSEDGRPALGLADLVRAQSAVRQNGDLATLVEILGKLAAAHVMAGDLPSSETAYREAVLLCQGGKSLPLLNVEQALALAHFARGSWSAAARHAERYLDLTANVVRDTHSLPIAVDLAEGAFEVVALLCRAHGSAADPAAATLSMERYRGFAWASVAPDRSRPSPASTSDLAAEIQRVTADGSTLLLTQLLDKEEPLAFVVAARGKEPILVRTNVTPEQLIDAVDECKDGLISDPRPFERLYDVLFRSPASATAFDGSLRDPSTTLEHVESTIRTSPAATLKIVAQSLFSLVPVAALRRRERGSNACLIEARPIVSAPTLSLLDRSPSSRAPKRVLLWASGAEGLENGRDEVESIRKILVSRGVDVETRERLSVRDVQRLAAERWDFHLVTHATFDIVRSFDCALHLDGEERLTLADILRLDLRGCTVVLAGCTTSLRDIRRLSTPLSLSAAFLLAGAARVIGNAWLVHDAAERWLLEAVHAEVAAGLGWAESVRKAQIRALRGELCAPEHDLRRPHFWAGLTCEGAP